MAKPDPIQLKPYLRSIALKDSVTPEMRREYPFGIPSIRNMRSIEFHPDVTFLVGENGSGKSTILEAIALAMGFGQEGGTKNVQISSADTVSPLFKYIKMVRGSFTPKDSYFLRAESFFNVATYMDEVGLLGGYGNLSLHEQSHGEAFMAVIMRKLRGEGIYLFDEPEAALSPMRQMAALTRMHALVQRHSQFIVATHSPILLAYPNAKIISLDDGKPREIAYEETSHFNLMRDFLNDYRRHLKDLLAPEE